MFTALIWVAWLSLMYSDFRNKRQPRMLIHQTNGYGPESHCMLVNLSQEILHVECVLAAALKDGEERSVVLGSEQIDPRKMPGPSELENMMRQGPLSSGQMLMIGSFEEILEALTDKKPAQGFDWLDATQITDLHHVEIRVVAVYGASDQSVGARRRFRLEGDEDDLLRVKPEQMYTDQIYQRRRRSIPEGWLRDCMDQKPLVAHRQSQEEG